MMTINILSINPEYQYIIMKRSFTSSDDEIVKKTKSSLLENMIMT